MLIKREPLTSKLSTKFKLYTTILVQTPQAENNDDYEQFKSQEAKQERHTHTRTHARTHARTHTHSTAQKSDKITVGVSGLCCCSYVTYFERCWLCVDSASNTSTSGVTDAWETVIVLRQRSKDDVTKCALWRSDEELKQPLTVGHGKRHSGRVSDLLRGCSCGPELSHVNFWVLLPALIVRPTHTPSEPARTHRAFVVASPCPLTAV